MMFNFTAVKAAAAVLSPTRPCQSCLLLLKLLSWLWCPLTEEWETASLFLSLPCAGPGLHSGWVWALMMWGFKSHKRALLDLGFLRTLPPLRAQVVAGCGVHTFIAALVRHRQADLCETEVQLGLRLCLKQKKTKQNKIK